jgi:uncharacterized protein
LIVVVSNTSPLIALSAIGRFSLLHDLYGQIWIPDAVRREIRGTTPGRAGFAEVEAAAWVTTQPAQGDFLRRALESELDRGEAEAIALASELRADFLLMDERRGRRVAGRFGIRVLGVLGVLLEAKQKGLLPKVEDALEDLLKKAGFRISAALYQRALEEAEEA